jgi:predicted DNA-binding ribbon-helix-helix protein
MTHNGTKSKIGQRGEHGSIVSSNYTINGKRTSIRLEEEFRSALNHIAQEEGRDVNDLLSELRNTPDDKKFSSRVHVFCLDWFWTKWLWEKHNCSPTTQTSGGSNFLFHVVDEE